MPHLSVRALFLLAVAGAPAAVPAAAQLPVNFGVAAGPSFSDNADKTGWHVQGSIEADLVVFPIGLRADLLMNQFDAGPADLRIFEVSGNLMYGLLATPIARPYFVGGLGFYSAKLTEGDGSADNDFALNAGAGVRLAAGALRAFIEARYHRLFGDTDMSYIPVSIGLMF